MESELLSVYETRKELLQVLHVWIGLGYSVLSITFYFLLMTVVRAMRRILADRGLHDDAADITQPESIALTIRKSRLIEGLMMFMVVGTALFFAGCGLHHLHTAFEVIPQAFEQGDLDEDVYVGNGAYLHHIVIEGAQVIGWPLLVGGGLALWASLRK
jgi:hypothetical protein